VTISITQSLKYLDFYAHDQLYRQNRATNFHGELILKGSYQKTFCHLHCLTFWVLHDYSASIKKAIFLNRKMWSYFQFSANWNRWHILTRQLYNQSTFVHFNKNLLGQISTYRQLWLHNRFKSNFRISPWADFYIIKKIITHFNINVYTQVKNVSSTVCEKTTFFCVYFFVFCNFLDFGFSVFLMVS
jgi:hypothetical protein